MKILFKLIVGIFLTITLTELSYAQTIERKVKGETYLFNGAMIANKSRTDMATSSTLGTDYSIPNNSVVASTVKRVLGEKRVKELRDKRLIFRFGCKPDGKIEKVFFIFPGNNYFLTLEEIAQLERAFLSERFPVKLYNKNIKELQFNQGCFFWRL